MNIRRFSTCAGLIVLTAALVHAQPRPAEALTEAADQKSQAQASGRKAQPKADDRAKTKQNLVPPDEGRSHTRGRGRPDQSRKKDNDRAHHGRKNDRRPHRADKKAGRPVHPFVYPAYVLPYPALAYPAPAARSALVRAGGIVFDVSPINAAVYVDGRYVGIASEFTSASFFSSSSRPLSLTDGRHHIELQADGYVPTAFEVEIVAGSVVPYKGSLAIAPQVPVAPAAPASPADGGIIFEVSPGEAMVYVDRQYVGVVSQFTSTSRLLLLAPGRHHVELLADGQMLIAFDVDVIAGAVVRYQGRFEQQ